MVAEGCVGASRRRAESWRTVGAHQELPVRPPLPPTRPRVPRVPHADRVARLRKQTKLKVIVALMTDKVQRGLEKRIQRVFAVKRTSKHPGVAKGRRGPRGVFRAGKYRTRVFARAFQRQIFRWCVRGIRLHVAPAGPRGGAGFAGEPSWCPPAGGDAGGAVLSSRFASDGGVSGVTPPL